MNQIASSSIIPKAECLLSPGCTEVHRNSRQLCLKCSDCLNSFEPHNRINVISFPLCGQGSETPSNLPEVTQLVMDKWAIQHRRLPEKDTRFLCNTREGPGPQVASMPQGKAMLPYEGSWEQAGPEGRCLSPPIQH